MGHKVEIFYLFGKLLKFPFSPPPIPSGPHKEKKGSGLFFLNKLHLTVVKTLAYPEKKLVLNKLLQLPRHFCAKLLKNSKNYPFLL